MKNKLAVLLLTPGLLASGAAAYAHHSFGSTYIVEKQSPLKEMLYKSHIALRIPSFHRGSRHERPTRPGRRGQRHLQSWRSRDRDRQSFAQCRQLPGTHDRDHSPLRREDLGRTRRRSGGLIQRTATKESAADFTDYADGAQLIPLTRAIRVIREIRG